jgi:hypothetical protein
MYIISLGPVCMTKYAINQMNYEAKTLPFDWMFSSLQFIKSVMMDNFKELLNRDNIQSTNPYYNPNKSFNNVYNKHILSHPNTITHLWHKNELRETFNFHMWNHYNLVEEEQYIKYKKYIDIYKFGYCIR